ncbi:MAG: DUF4143 domain-containing protein [Prolixibacteraceae bacterium]|nr:DUF4143 domain-containing protein [Prolixibacteraceae bacterium]
MNHFYIKEKVFIIFHLGTFSRNLRNELKNPKKFYFYDNGVRNALIANFRQPELRQDIGALWENWIIAERQKYLMNSQNWANQYYWRTKGQQEIDYIEEKNGMLYCYEFKWNTNNKAKLPKTFSNAYPNHEFQVIHSGNFEDFVLIE